MLESHNRTVTKFYQLVALLFRCKDHPCRIFLSHIYWFDDVEPLDQTSRISAVIGAQCNPRPHLAKKPVLSSCRSWITRENPIQLIESPSGKLGNLEPHNTHCFPEDRQVGVWCRTVSWQNQWHFPCKIHQSRGHAHSPPSKTMSVMGPKFRHTNQHHRLRIDLTGFRINLRSTESSSLPLTAQIAVHIDFLGHSGNHSVTSFHLLTNELLWALFRSNQWTTGAKRASKQPASPSVG